MSLHVNHLALTERDFIRSLLPHYSFRRRTQSSWIYTYFAASWNWLSGSEEKVFIVLTSEANWKLLCGGRLFIFYFTPIFNAVPMYRPVGRSFQRGIRRLASRVAHLAGGPLKAPRSPGVFGAQSCNLAISRHFIQTFEKSCCSKLIFKIFIKFYIKVTKCRL